PLRQNQLSIRIRGAKLFPKQQSSRSYDFCKIFRFGFYASRIGGGGQNLILECLKSRIWSRVVRLLVFYGFIYRRLRAPVRRHTVPGGQLSHYYLVWHHYGG